MVENFSIKSQVPLTGASKTENVFVSLKLITNNLLKAVA